VGVDKWDVWDQPAAASDDIRLVDRELTEPADLSASEFCQRSGPQLQKSLLLLRSTPRQIGPGAVRYDRRRHSRESAEMIHRGPAIEIPDTPLVPFVLHRAGELSSKPALIDGLTGRELTYGALADGVKRVASALRRRGFRKGDVFAILSPNLIEYPIAFFAVASLGGVITTINSLYTPRELADQLENSGARILLTVPAFMDRVREGIKDLAIEEVFVFGDTEGATSFGELLAQEPEDFTVDINPAEDLVALPYSSGTTGVAKGVMLTHRNLVANVVQSEECFHLPVGERVLGVMPFYHIYGMTVIMNMTLHSGATIVTMP
jgi:acyl-CoA synthetase (AMP-forming)/AMP-acid ligase II